MKIKRISFTPTEKQREMIAKLPREINVSEELRKCLDKVLEKYEKQKAQVTS